jgi:hypothetical protein
MWQKTGDGSQSKPREQQKCEDLVSKSSEDSVYRRQVGSGETHEGVYAMYPFWLSQKGRLIDDMHHPLRAGRAQLGSSGLLISPSL